MTDFAGSGERGGARLKFLIVMAILPRWRTRAITTYRSLTMLIFTRT